MVTTQQTSGAAIFTADHDLHKARRQPMNAFFSKTRVANHQELIRKHLGKLTSRLVKFAESKEQCNFGAAVTALARDVANEFILAKSYNSLEQDDFGVDLLLASQGSGAIWRLSKHSM
jgi:cytochrome P450